MLFSKIFGRGIIKEERFLVLDIGSQTIKAILFSVSKGRGRIIGAAKVVRREAKPGEEILSDPAELILNCGRAIRLAAGELSADVRTIIGVSGAALRGEVTKMSFVREDQRTKIDLLEIKNVLQKIQWRAYEKIKRKLSLEAGYPESEIRLIGAWAERVGIDGYPVSEPLGMQGKEITLSIFNTYISQGNLDVIEKIGRELNLKIFHVASEAYALAKSLKPQIFSEHEGAVLLDVGAGLTAVSLIRRGFYEGTKIFSLGGANFTKKIAAELGIGFWEAEEIKLKYSRGLLSSGVSQKIARIFESDMAVLGGGAEMALAESKQTDVFPPDIFILGGCGQLRGLEKYLKNYNWNQYLPFGEPPRIRMLGIEDFDNLEDMSSYLKGPEDLPAAGLAGLALKLLGEEDILNRTLRRILRIMQFS